MVKEKFSIGVTEDARLIRTEVFVVEQGFKNEFDELDDEAWELVLYLDNVPVSTGRLEKIDPETYRIERVAVRKAYRGLQFGTYTMKFLMRKILEIGGHIAVVHAQADKTAFYKKLGFKEIKDAEIIYDEGCPHVLMKKELRKKRY